MKGATHIMAGVTAALYYCTVCSVSAVDAYPLIALSAAASLLPDIDTSTSKLGRKIAPASWLINNVFGHRTLFHSITLYVLGAAALHLLLPQYPLLPIALLLGAGTHLVLDLMNHQGLMLFFPIQKRYCFKLCRSGGVLDWTFRLGLIAATVILLQRYVAA